MVAPAAAPEATPKPRRRARWQRRGVVVLLLVWLIGRGAGLFSSGEANDPPPAADAPPSPRVATTGDTANARDGLLAAEPSTHEQLDQRLATLTAAPSANEAQGTANPPAAAPLTETAAVPEPSPAPSPAAEPAIDDDRFASRVGLVQHRITEVDLAGAAAALAHLQALPLSLPQRVELSALTRQFDAAVAAACGRVLQCLSAGEAVRARDAMRGLLGDEPQRLLPLLDQALALAGARQSAAALPGAADGPLPAPRPLARGREVRLLANGQVQTGRVADARATEVTVRLVTAQGTAFPTVPVVSCELVEPTADEAAEMGFAALRAGDLLLARAWHLCALLRVTSPSPRVEQLGSRLRPR